MAMKVEYVFIETINGEQRSDPGQEMEADKDRRSDYKQITRAEMERKERENYRKEL